MTAPGHSEFWIAVNGVRLRATLEVPSARKWPLVILCHGFLSWRNSLKYRTLAGALVDSGFAALRFDFRGCGDSGGDPAASTVTARSQDLKAVITAASSLEGFDGRLGLLGSSMGGFLALLAASRNDNIRCVVCWSTPAAFDDLLQRAAAAGHGPLPPLIREDLRQQQLPPSLSALSKVLVIHGGADELVPPGHAYLLHQALAAPKCLHVLPMADHRFSAPAVRRRAVNLSIDWFRTYL